MRFFDSNCYLGRFNHWGGTQPTTAESLLETLDHHGIHEALVVSSLARENHPLDGNEEVLKLTRGQPRLHPAWAALPPTSREMPSPCTLLDEMEERAVRALFVFPKQYGFSLDDWCVDSLLGPLADRRVPLFICPNGLLTEATPPDQVDWPNVVRICRAFPDLPVVVTECRTFLTLRLVYQALDACPNLRLDMSAYWVHGLLEFVVREWGAERLLFGSGLPTRNPSAALAQVAYADLPAAEVSVIAGGNLRRLLSWGKSALPRAEVSFPPPVDDLHAVARARGSLTGQGFLDGHGHLGRHNMQPLARGAPAELVREMDRLGVARAIVFASTGLNSDERAGNDLVAAAVRAYPDRFIGFVYLNLNRDEDEIRREAERGFAIGLQGIKLHPAFQGYDTNGPKVELACAIASERRCLIVNHDWGSSERLLYLCRRYPSAGFITGHTSPAAAHIARGLDNLYIGSCAFVSYGSVEDFVERAGAERILFGSDLSWAPIAWGLGPILYARIPLTDKRLILGGNLQRLLSLYR